MKKSNFFYEIVLLSLVSVIIAIIIFCYFMFDSLNYKNALEFGEKRLTENLVQQRHNIVEMFTRETATIEIIAKSMIYMQNDADRLSVIKDYEIKAGYDVFLISDMNGNAITSKNEFINISDFPFFKTVLEKKQTVISEPFVLSNNQEVIAIATYMHSQKRSGVIAGIYNVNYLNSLLKSSYEGLGHDVVVANDGKIIVETLDCTIHGAFGESLADVFTRGIYKKVGGFQQDNLQIRLRIDNHQNGKSIIQLQQIESLVLFEPLGINNWYIFSIAPLKNITGFSKNTELFFLPAILILMCILITIATYYVFSKKRIGKRILLIAVLLVVIASASGIAGAVTLLRTINEYSHVLKNYSYGLADVGNIALHMSEIRSYIRDVVFLNEKDKKEEALKKIDDASRKTDYYLASVKDKLQTQKALALWKTYEILLESYRVSRLKVIDSAFSPNEAHNKAAYDLWINDCSPKLNACINILNELIDLNINGTKIIDSRLKIEGISALVFIISIIIIAFGTSIILCFILARSISNPLAKIEIAAKRIAANDTDFELDIHSNDEIGVVAQVLNTNVKSAFDELKQKNKTIFESLTYARKIQGNLLPNKQQFENAFADYFVFWEPRDTVGGDIYWLENFETGTVLCVCDCTGHGTPGALLTMLVISALDSIINEWNASDPARIMFLLEKKLSNVLNTQEHKQDMTIKDGVDLCVLFKNKENQITMACANMHVFICNGTEIQTVKGQRLRIGEGNLQDKNEINVIQIPANDKNKFYIASDGLFDQIGGNDTMPFGYSIFKKIILENHTQKLELTTQKIITAFNEHKGNELRRDDTMLISFKP